MRRNSLCFAEKKNNGQLDVIDIPAGLFGSDSSEAADDAGVKDIQGSSVSGVGDVEVIPLNVKDVSDADSSIEDVEVKPPREDFFSTFRLPQLFVYRRPVIQDPFSSFSPFPIFRQRPQQQTFSPAQPSQFNVMNHMEGNFPFLSHTY
jgi:hypothetical protein